MSGRLRAGSYLRPPGKTIEDVCWKCRLQLQRRGLYARTLAGSSQAVSTEEGKSLSNKDGLRANGEPAVSPSTSVVQATSGNVSDKTGPERSEIPDSSQHRVPDVPGSVLSTEPSTVKGFAVHYLHSFFTKGPGYKKTKNPYFEQARRQIVRRAYQESGERQLKAKLSDAIQLSKLDTALPNNYNSPPVRQLHVAQPNRLGLSPKGPSRYGSKQPTRQYSTTAPTKPIPDDAFPISFDKLQTRDDEELDRPGQDGMRIREQLRLWQEEQDAIAELNPAPAVCAGSNAGLLANYIASTPGDSLLAEPVEIENQSTDLDPPSGNDDEIMETNEGQPVLLPGDLVEMSVGRNTVLAIYVRTFVRQAQFYTMQGKWIHNIVRNLSFSVPQFVGLAEVAQIFPFLPQADVARKDLDQSHQLGAGVPRSAGASMVEKMNEFVRDSNQVYRAHADRIDHAFDLVADEKRLQIVTLSAIASTILQIPDPSTITFPALWAVHRALFQVELGFKLDYRDHWRTGMFEIVSKREVSLVMNVRQWLREFRERLISQATQNPPKQSTPPKGVDGARVIADFVTNTRRIVKESRKYRPLTASGYISTSSVQLEAKIATVFDSRETATRNVVSGYFTEQETEIIRFLELWATKNYLRKSSRLSAMGPMLLRAVGMYEGFDLDEAIGCTFLQEIGVLAPWENRVAFNTRLALPQYNFDNVTEELLSNATLSLADWKPKDSMEHLRKDWKDLEVFCVDSAAAREIDDGFSLEPIEGDEAHFWVHVHVANPTAFLTPEDPISKYAGRLIETIYLPDRSYHMLNPRITQHHFSLHRNRPALTFSAKLNASGDIVDINITPSIVRNVKFYTPEYLIEQLAPDGAEINPTSSLTVGKNSPPTFSGYHRRNKMKETLDDSQKKTLHKLLELGTARHRHRESNGAIFARFYKREVSVHYVDNTLPFRRTIRRIEGDPTITVDAVQFDPAPSQQVLEAEATGMLVPHLMLLTCEVAALWTGKRGIPMFYRGTERNPELASASEYKENVLDPMTKKYGTSPYLESLRYMHLAGRGYSSPDPIPHQVIGTEAYTKVTSPLRRYGDMLAHWQIEAALRHEAETGESLVGKRDHPCLPFSRSQVQEIIPHLSVREAIITQAKRFSQVHWTLQALYRAHEFKEAVLTDTFEIYICKPDLWGRDILSGVTKEFALPCFVRPNKETAAQGPIQTGDWWEGKIETIDLYSSFLWMTPARLIKRTRSESAALDR